MQFKELYLKGAYLLEQKPGLDSRGSFTRIFCEETFAHHGLNFKPMQSNISTNLKKDTLRGMHYQIAPYSEIKLIQCLRGAIYDVIVDIRPTSPTFGQWIAEELSEDKPSALYVPEGFAHGFQTLTDNAWILYQISNVFQPKASRGIHFDDPAIGIKWPKAQQRIISEKDQNLPHLSEAKGE